MKPPCLVDGCEKPSERQAPAPCRMHRARLERRGSTDDTRWSRAPEPKRFERNVAFGEPQDCWLWTAGVNNQGYGVFRTDGRKQTYAHRWSYTYFVGPIPDGLYVLHSCDTPRCVNPRHLRTGTQLDNMADMVARGRGRARGKTVAS